MLLLDLAAVLPSDLLQQLYVLGDLIQLFRVGARQQLLGERRGAVGIDGH